jgi:SAM-dependent methyltransferase
LIVTRWARRPDSRSERADSGIATIPIIQPRGIQARAPVLPAACAAIRRGNDGEMSEQQPVTLADAYALVTPQDSRELYARWAATYESDFVALNEYVIPDRVAEVFADTAGRVEGPVLDVGCGTGLVAAALVREISTEATDWVIDGVDISPEMLAVSAAKTRPDGQPLYRRLLEADLTASVDLADGSYAGVLSAGTFTHGHLGPAALSALIRFGRPGANFAIGINAEHFSAVGFADQLADELAAGSIRDLDPKIVDMYLPDSVHYGQKAVIAVFRRA